MDPAPATLDGAIGNLATIPHSTKLRGPNAGKYAVGPTLSDGAQVVRIYSDDGTLLETQEVRKVNPKDDHNHTGMLARADGGLTVAASGHNTNTVMTLGYRSPAGVWTFQTKTYSDVTTYPCLFLDELTDKVIFIIRVGNTTWTYRTQTGQGAWTNPVTFITASEQLYCTPRHDPVMRQLHFNGRYNNGSPNGGPLRTFSMDMITETFSSSGGALTVPFALTDIPIFQSNDPGRTLNVEDQTHDYMSVFDDEDTNLHDTRLRVYKYIEGQPRHLLSSWQIGPVFTNMQGRGDAAGYVLGFRLAREPHTGWRAYITRGYGSLYSTEQWENTGSHMVLGDYVMDRLRRSQDATDVMFRALSMENATERSPIVVGTFDVFTDFDSYTNSEVVFLQPRRGERNRIVPGYQPRQETLDWVARSPTPPSEKWLKRCYDPFFSALVAAGLWGKLDIQYLLKAHDPLASLLNLKGPSYTLTQASSLPNSAFQIGHGWTGGVGYLETGLNPSTAVGQVGSRDSAHISGHCVGQGFRGDVDVAGVTTTDIGNSNTRILFRSAAGSPTADVRINQGTSTGIANTKKASQTVIVSRTNSTGGVATLGGRDSAFTMGSAAPSNDTIRALTRSGSAALSSRTLAGFGAGSGLTTAERLALTFAYMDYENAVLELLGPQL